MLPYFVEVCVCVSSASRFVESWRRAGRQGGGRSPQPSTTASSRVPPRLALPPPTPTPPRADHATAPTTGPRRLESLRVPATPSPPLRPSPSRGLVWMEETRRLRLAPAGRPGASTGPHASSSREPPPPPVRQGHGAPDGNTLEALVLITLLRPSSVYWATRELYGQAPQI